MSFPPRFLDDLRARLTLSEIIGRSVKLTRAGREWKACCPFHREKSPSFYVNDEKQFFHCFGCGAHGDVIGFTMRHDNLSFPEAVERLAAVAGLPVPQTRPEDAQQAARDKSLFAMMEAAAKWFEAQLEAPENRAVAAYVAGRGLSPETMAGFRVGYAPGNDQALRRHLATQGFSDDQMKLMGLLKAREKDGSLYAFFRERVMFPVADRAGRVIAFGGRILPETMRAADRADFKPPKYVNSPETPLFHKGRTVYALAQARQAAADGQRVIVVEGYMDAIACHQAGFTGAVAPLGTALTEEQITLLWRIMPGKEKVIDLCFDGDEAGRRAAFRAAERILPLLKPDCSARIAFLPEGEDPDTLIQKQGKEAFEGILAGGVPLGDFLWGSYAGGRGLIRPEDRAGLEAELNGLIEKIADKGVQYHYRAFFRQKMFEKFRSAPRMGKGRAGANVPVVSVSLRRPSAAQTRAGDILLATLINHPVLFHEVDEQIGSLTLSDPSRDRLRQDAIQALSGGDFESADSLTAHLRDENPGCTELLDAILSDFIYLHARFSRPESDLDEARQGWRDVWQRLENGHSEGFSTKKVKIGGSVAY